MATPYDLAMDETGQTPADYPLAAVRTQTESFTPEQATEIAQSDPGFAAKFGSTFPAGSLILRGPNDPNRPPPMVGPPPWVQQQEAAAQAEKSQDEARRMAIQLPTAQAAAAYSAALKYQAQRGYASDLASGKSPAEAIAKWAPMLFADHPQAVEGAVRAMTPPQPISVQDIGGQKVIVAPNPRGAPRVTPLRPTPPAAATGPIEAQPIYAPGTTNAIPGRYVIPGERGARHVITVPQTGTSNLSSRDVLAALRGEAKDLATKLAKASNYRGNTNAIAADQDRLTMVRQQIAEMLSKAGVAVPRGTGGSSFFRVTQ